MRILSEQDNPITYDMREIVKKILQVLREDQNLDFGPRLQNSSGSRKSIRQTISSKKQLLKKSNETINELAEKLASTKTANDDLREELLERLGSTV
jgi:septal ring factor EnvC (AmiA/AmiB activator)